MKKILFLALIILSAYAFGENSNGEKALIKTTKLSTHYVDLSKVDSMTITRPVNNIETGKKEMKISLFLLRAATSAYKELSISMLVSFIIMFVWFFFVRKNEELALWLVALLTIFSGLALVYFHYLAEFENIVIQLWLASLLVPAAISVLLFICEDDIQITVRNIFIAIMLILQAFFFLYLEPGAIMFFIFSCSGLVILFIILLISYGAEKLQKTVNAAL